MHLHRSKEKANRWFAMLILLLILGLGVASLPCATLAATDPVQDYILRMKGVLESLDEDGRAALATVRSNVEGITDDDWEDILTVDGKNLQEFVDGKIGNGKSKEIFGNLIKIIYGTKEGLESDIRVYRINYAPYFDIIFGDERAVDTFFAFLNESLREYEARLRALLSGSSPERYTSLDEVVRDAMRSAAEKTGLDQTLAKGLEIGVEDFLTIKERLDAYIDPDRRGLQALVWGSARSGGVSISGPETVRAGQVGRYALSFIDGKTVQSGASDSPVGLVWKSSDPRLASFDPENEGLLKAHSEGKVRIEAWLLGYKIAEKDVVVTVSRTGGGSEAEGDKQGEGRQPLELKISEDTVTRALAESPGNEARFIRLELADVALKPGDTVKVTLSGHSLSKIESAQKGLNITLSGLGLVLPHDALPAFVDSDGDFSLTVRVEEAKNTPVRIAAVPTTEVVSFAYTIEGPGSLKRPIDVTLKLADGGTDARKVGAYLKQADGSWKYIGGRADATKKTLTAKMSRFGTVAAIAYHKTFADLQNHWAKDVVEVLAAHHIVKGKSEDVFAPNENVTRAEFAALMLNALGLPVERAAHPFRDVPEGAWYRDIVATAYRHGLMAGDGQTFRPNAPITREEMAVVLVNALGMKDEAAGKAPTFADSAGISAWARGAVGLAQEKGLIRGVGDNRFAPKANAKRAEAAALLYNAVFQP